MSPLKRKTPRTRDEQDDLRRLKFYFQGEADTPAERMAAIRQLRKGQILNYLLQEGSASRVDVARALGFNLRTVSLLVASLIEDNIVVEKPTQISTMMGRRPVPLELNFSAASIMAIEVEREQSRFVLMDLQGNFLVEDKHKSDFGDVPEAQAEWLVSATREFLANHHKDLPPLAGVGFSFDGFVFRQHAASKHGTITEPIRKALEDALGIPVSADTNSRLIAIAEQRFGSASGERNALTLNIGDGFSLGCINDGKILTGNHGIAGELGHIPLGQPGVPCYCGGSGCLENIVSGSGLRRMAREANLPATDDKAVFRQVLDLAPKNKAAAKTLDNFWHHLALAITIGANLYDPEVIVISGSAAKVLEPHRAHLETKLKELAVPFIMDQVTLRFSTLGDNVVLLGAGGQILNSIYSASHVAAETLL